MTLHHRFQLVRKMTTKSVLSSRDGNSTTAIHHDMSTSQGQNDMMEEGVELISLHKKMNASPHDESVYHNNGCSCSSDIDDCVSVPQQHGINEFETGASIIKAIMGAGSFALPWAFSQMGYVAGPLFLTILMFLAVYSLKILVRVSRNCSATTIGGRTSSSSPSSYVDVARATFGTTGAILSYAASISASIGVCGSYLVFIAANLQSLLLATLSGANKIDASQSTLVLLTLPFAIGLSSVRDMKHFAFTSLLGDISVMLGMAVVLIYGFFYHDPSPSQSMVSTTDADNQAVAEEHHDADGDWMAIGSLDTIPLALGSIGYLFLIHFLVLPIESSMARRENFDNVATQSFAACAVLSGTFGIIGYGMFGSNTEQIVLLNVEGSWFVSAVQLLLCIDLLFTYPVVMRPSIVIIEQSLSKIVIGTHDNSSHYSRFLRCVIMDGDNGVSSVRSPHAIACVSLGCIAAAASIFIPAFGLLSGLVGGVSQAFLAFCFPLLMMARQHQQQRQRIDVGTTIVDNNNSLWNNLPVEDRVVVSFGVALIGWTLISSIREVT